MIISQVNSARQLCENIFDSGLKLNDLPSVMEFDGQSMALNFLYFPVTPDESGVEINEPIIVKRAPCAIDMRNQSFYKMPDGQDFIADTLFRYAQSAEEYFDFCINAAPFVSSVTYDQNCMDHLSQWLRDKHEFFQGIFKRTIQSGILRVQNCLCSINGNQYKMTDFTCAFNVGSQAAYSLPAFLAITLMGFVVAESDFGPITKGIFNPNVPIKGHPNEFQKTTTFGAYLKTYLQGDWLMNNQDVFLTLYALASAVADFVGEIQDYDKNIVSSFQDATPYKPLLDLLNWLVQGGALRDPFSSEIGYVLDDGIANAAEASQELYATLKLMPVCNFAPVGSPPGTLAIFYALIDLFSLRGYFGIDPDIKFQYQQ